MKSVSYPKTLNQWLAYLESQHPEKNIVLGLERIQNLLPRVLPKKFTCPIITVAGTNGKGSCVATLEAILQTAGYKTGVYTSPHLWRVNERIRFNNRYIQNKELAAVLEKVEAIRKQIPITYFEFLTLAAIRFFYEKKPDILILEVGLGGRLDAVNILDPSVSIITNVDFDHCALLGNTREAIAYEKSGIMRANRSLVCGDFLPPSSLTRCSTALNVKAQFIGQDYWWQSHQQEWAWGSRARRVNHLTYNALLLRNTATAIAAVTSLGKKYFIKDEAIQQGLKRIHLPARQFIQKHPHSKVTQIFDVAHNPQSLRALAHLLSEKTISGRNLAVFSILEDKVVPGVIQPLLNKIDHWFIAPLKNPRAASLEKIANILKNNNFSSFPTIQTAYLQALAYANTSDRIIICGSFHTVAECFKNQV